MAGLGLEFLTIRVPLEKGVREIEANILNSELERRLDREVCIELIQKTRGICGVLIHTVVVNAHRIATRQRPTVIKQAT